MEVGQEARAPMRARRQRNFNGAELHRLPVIELVHDVEAQVVHQIADANRDGDRLIGRDLGERAPVEMVEVREYSATSATIPSSVAAASE